MANNLDQYKCPKCGKQMAHEVRKDRLTYRRRSAEHDQPGWWCPDGHDAVFSDAEAQIWDVANKALRSRVDGELGSTAMTPPEVARIRQKLGLSQRAAGEVLGGGQRAFTKYENGSVAVSEPMANLLRLLDRDPRRLGELRGDRAA